MIVLTEGDLQLVLPEGLKGRNFDKEYAASHCMKAVDFVLDEHDRTIFLEMKDPEHPRAPAFSIEDYLSGRLVEDLTYKFRDTFLYRWACDQVTKPIYYYAIVAIETLSSSELTANTDVLRRRLPARSAAPASWSRVLVEDCALLNIAAWNRIFPEWHLSRVSASR